ncbi:MAG: zinc-dependent alcohol dehydrogenase [Acidimicrobiia bacterium]
MSRTTTGLSKMGKGSDNLAMREFSIPELQEGLVLLEVISAGICGTDLHIADDEFPSNPPVTMGHEVTGEVADVGPNGNADLIGQRFAAETYFSYCEECEFCRTGRPNLCEQRRSFGSHVDGGFARWLVLPERNLHPLPDTVGRHAGSLAEPLACVAHCLLDPAQVQAGDRVLVLGPGTMGVLTAQVARACGGDVTLAGLPSDARRLAVAESVGIRTVTLDPSDSWDGVFDVVCECSGAAAAARLALGAVRKGGEYVQVGIFGQAITLDLDELLYKEIRFASGFASTPASWRRAMRLIDEGLVELDPLITEVVPLSEWERAFAATREGAGMKFVLDPRDGETG